MADTWNPRMVELFSAAVIKALITSARVNASRIKALKDCQHSKALLNSQFPVSDVHGVESKHDATAEPQTICYPQVAVWLFNEFEALEVRHASLSVFCFPRQTTTDSRFPDVYHAIANGYAVLLSTEGSAPLELVLFIDSSQERCFDVGFIVDIK
jgi:hypothetical protein